MDNIRAYGAGMAGGAFDRSAFMKKPTVIFRFIALISGIILWAAISNGGWHEPASGGQSVCLYGNSSSACSFGSAMGFFAVAAAILLLIVDGRFEKISAIQTRKRVVVMDLAVSAIFAVVFLITFFMLLSKYNSLELDEPYKGSLAKAGIFFALISLAAWGGAAFFAWRRYEEGALTAFAPSYEQEFAPGIGGSDYGYDNSGTGVVVDSYQNAPFTAINTQGSPVDVKHLHQGY
uniref:Synaptogyrin n=1 Tax=Parascaris univalens TaxID=6257 RepID=A0A915CAU2_PARUN